MRHGYAAAYGFSAVDPSSQAPLVGASGAIAGVLGAYLLATSGGNWLLPAIYMATLALISTASTFLVPETRGRDLLRLEDAVNVSTDEGHDRDADLPVVPIAR